MNAGTAGRGTAIVALALLLADQLTKFLTQQFDEHASLGPIEIGTVLNRDGVFGLPIGNDLLIAGGVLIAIGLGFLISRTHRREALVGLWLLLAGTLSNTLDRIFYGGVVDIVSIGPSSHFNLADVLIILGAVALLFSLWSKDDSDDERQKQGQWQ